MDWTQKFYPRTKIMLVSILTLSAVALSFHPDNSLNIALLIMAILLLLCPIWGWTRILDWSLAIVVVGLGIAVAMQLEDEWRFVWAIVGLALLYLVITVIMFIVERRRIRNITESVSSIQDPPLILRRYRSE
jgi:cell division protein FtsW (lipid II flippase)